MRTGNAEDEPPQGWAPDSADFNRSKFLEISPEGLQVAGWNKFGHQLN